jgi:hypothetical protein
MQPFSLPALHAEFSAFAEHVVLYLPRTSDLRQLAKMVDDEKKTVVMHYCMGGASKALCIYCGGFNFDAASP